MINLELNMDLENGGRVSLQINKNEDTTDAEQTMAAAMAGYFIGYDFHTESGGVRNDAP